MQHFACPALDVVCVHSYSASTWASSLPSVVQTAQSSGKRIIVEEFGDNGSSGSKASSLQQQITDIQSQGVPWMVWEVLTPNNNNDFETFTDDTASWDVLTASAQAAQSATTAAFA